MESELRHRERRLAQTGQHHLALQRQPRLPVDAIARGTPGTALLISGTRLFRVWLPSVPSHVGSAAQLRIPDRLTESFHDFALRADVRAHLLRPRRDRLGFANASTTLDIYAHVI